jgi:hypothetical protein
LRHLFDAVFGVIVRSRAWLEAAQSAERGRQGVHTDVSGGVVCSFGLLIAAWAFAGIAAKTEIKSAIAKLMEF